MIAVFLKLSSINIFVLYLLKVTMCLHNFFLFCFYFHFVLFSRKIRRAAKRVPKRDRISTVSQYDIDKLNKKRFVFMFLLILNTISITLLIEYGQIIVKL